MSKTSDAADFTILKNNQVDQQGVQAWQFVDLDQQRKELIARQAAENKNKAAQPAKLIKQEAFEQAKRDGFEQGYQEGFEQGQEAGLQAAAQENNQKLQELEQRVKSLISFLKQPHQQLQDIVFEQVAELAIQLAENFISSEVPANKEQLIALIKEAITQLNPHPQTDDPVMALKLAHEDLAAIEKVLKSTETNLKIIVDEQLESGCFKLNYQYSEVSYDWRAEMKNYLENAAEVLQLVQQKEHVTG
ncbi:FliH/SctL family protein [Thiomicrospira sp. ALE5]|uniref:FliH/SctL family protein n=1 Tax=Thiomicrospira sp. ALE5 TaxID=748650 RepID=UPI0008E3F46A|nr:FliH/SctL family protein [Thiomicrospira sp. ALE5]SFR59263.1 flagellar assembly protein FliH [Thiomicrospira sp. ALE5]